MLHNPLKFMGCFLTLLPMILTLYSSSSQRQPVTMSSNFKIQKTSSCQHSPIKLDEPLPLPIILTNPGQYKSNRPLFQKYSLRKYQLYDSKYQPDLNKISRLDQQLAFNMQPPTGVFEQCSKIVIQNYRLLQLKQFKITLINPSERYRFCVEEIFIDSQQITRQEKRPLPFCLNSTTKYPFFFSLYITQHKPLIFKGTVYFIINVYDGDILVDQKIWPKQIIVKVTHNHLRIIPLQIRNCNKDNSIVMIRNPQKWDLSLVIIYKRKLYELTGQPIDGNILIPALKSYKFIIDGKDSKMTIYTKSVAVDITYPVLYVPIYCIQDLVVDYFNIGILSDDRSLLQFPVTVSSYSNSTIYIQEVTLRSSTQTVELLPLREKFNYHEIQPNVRHFIIARVVIHGSRVNMQAQRSYFQVAVKYMMLSQPKQLDNNKPDSLQYRSNHQTQQYQLRQTKTTFHYCQMRSPISVAGKRYIDISKLSDGTTTSVAQNAFPIRNNLNLPINLIRVIYDQSKFKLLWLQDKRDYIFPNHQRDQFSLQYIGSRSLAISPMKYVALLEFNGNLFIPLEIIVYDKTLQCVYDDLQAGKPVKCADLAGIQFGYFDQAPPKDPPAQNITAQPQGKRRLRQPQKPIDYSSQPVTKTRRLAIRNWNPESKNVKVGIEQNSVTKYGFNTTVRILGPYPEYDIYIKTDNNLFEFYLKGNHYFILEIEMTPLPNATSGTLPLRILTAEEHITKPIKFKVENGTIALIPQISRFQSFYKKSVEYLNLVSTYREPYRIKSITSNLSNLLVYSNNYSQIYQNQWIGMALIYQPFMGQWNITQQCCSQRKGVQRLFKDLRVGSNRPTPVEIRLKTSTQLQTMALVLIDRSSPPLIQLPYSHQFSVRQKFRKDAQRIDIHLIDDGNVEKFEYKLKVKNLFEDYLKGNVLMFDEELIERLEEYGQYRLRVNDKVQMYFCLRNDVKVKHNFTPQLVKTLFNLASLPAEITVQPLTNTSYYINSQVPPRQQVVQASKFSQYFRQTISSGSRMCYRFQGPLYIRNLIQTGVVNWFSQEYRFQILSQFIRKELQQLEVPTQAQPSTGFISQITVSSTKYNLLYDEFFAQYYVDREYFCKGERNQARMTAFFRFCQHVNVRMRYLERDRELVGSGKLEDETGNNTTVNAEGQKKGKDINRETTKKIKRRAQKQVNRYFILPPLASNQAQQPTTQNPSALQPNQLQLGFQIYPITHRTPSLSPKYRSIIQNPHLPKQPAQPLPPTKPSAQQHQQPQFLTTPSFYLVLLNNYTSYQLYHQKIGVSKPKVRVKSVIVNGEMIEKGEFERNYFGGMLSPENRLKESPGKDTSQADKLRKPHQRNKWLPIYIQDKQLTIKPNGSSLPDQSLQFQFNPQQYRIKIRELLLKGNVDSIFVEGEKSFQIANEGQADIAYTHVGFQNEEVACLYRGVRVVMGPCTEDWVGEEVLEGQKQQKEGQGQKKQDQTQSLQSSSSSELSQPKTPPPPKPLISYKMLPKSSSLIKIRYSIALKDLVTFNPRQQPYIQPINLYLYNGRSYHIQLMLKFRLADELETLLKNINERQCNGPEGEKFFLTKVWNTVLNVLAVIFICATILKFRQEELLTRKAMMKKAALEFSSVNVNKTYQFSVNNSPMNYQKAYKRLKLKTQLYPQPNSLRQASQPSFQIIDPALYPYTIGTPFPTKPTNLYHPIVTVSEDFLHSIKVSSHNESKILHNYFNESEESEIIGKNQHEINENISLTINLDDVTENQHRQDQSVSEESLFEFDVRNNSQLKKGKEHEREEDGEDEGEDQDFSQASESQLPDGQEVQVTDEILNQSDSGFGFESQAKKKPVNTSITQEQQTQQKNQAYYSVFNQYNPLKKKQQSTNNGNNLFSWMNENKKRSRLKW